MKRKFSKQIIFWTCILLMGYLGYRLSNHWDWMVMFLVVLFFYGTISWLEFRIFMLELRLDEHLPESSSKSLDALEAELIKSKNEDFKE